jgi:hypothetical protein
VLCELCVQTSYFAELRRRSGRMEVYWSVWLS